MQIFLDPVRLRSQQPPNNGALGKAGGAATFPYRTVPRARHVRAEEDLVPEMDKAALHER